MFFFFFLFWRARGFWHSFFLLLCFSFFERDFGITWSPISKRSPTVLSCPPTGEDRISEAGGEHSEMWGFGPRSEKPNLWEASSEVETSYFQNQQCVSINPPHLKFEHGLSDDVKTARQFHEEILSHCHLTLLVQKEWYPTFLNLCLPNPDKDTAWNPRKEKEKIKMISYSYPHPNRPPPLPPSYKESEEGLTIQVEFLWKWKFFSFIWRKIYEKGWPGWVFLEWKVFSRPDKIWERIFFSQCRIFWCCFWEGKY